MAETEFEQDLRHMFDQPAPRLEPDAASFTAGVDQRLDRARWLRAALLAGFGVLGLAIALALGVSPSQFQPIADKVAEAGTSGETLGDAAVWTAAGLLVLVAAVFFLRPASSEA